MHMLLNMWESVMDSNNNPLRELPKTVRFQLMLILSCLWSTIFCVSAGLMIYLPGYILAHLGLLLIGFFGTAWLFRLFGRSN